MTEDKKKIEYITILTPMRLSPGESQTHAGDGQIEHVTAELEKVKEEVASVTAQASSLVDAANKNTPSGYSLHQIQFQLGLTAKGKVGFLGSGWEAEAAATFTLTFQRIEDKAKLDSKE